MMLWSAFQQHHSTANRGPAAEKSLPTKTRTIIIVLIGPRIPSQLNRVLISANRTSEFSLLPRSPVVVRDFGSAAEDFIAPRSPFADCEGHMSEMPQPLPFPQSPIALIHPTLQAEKKTGHPHELHHRDP